MRDSMVVARDEGASFVGVGLEEGVKIVRWVAVLAIWSKRAERVWRVLS